MSDRPILERHFYRDAASASAADPCRQPFDPRRRRRSHALLALVVGATLLPTGLSAQSASGTDRSIAKGKVVVEHSTGDLDLSAPAPRATRLVRVGGTVSDTLDGSSLAGARIEVVEAHVSARTTENGHFQLGPVAPGSYTVRVTRMG